MRKVELEPEKLKLEVAYRGVVYTVARAVYPSGAERPVVAEGVARRSCKDKPSLLGEEIALGRAEAALRRKLAKKPVHRVLMG